MQVIPTDHLKTHEAQLNYIIDHVHIGSNIHYRIFDTNYQVYRNKAVQHHVAPLSDFGNNHVALVSEQYELMIREISTRLYKQFYCSMDLRFKKTVFPYKREREAVIETLSKANTSRVTLDSNWTVYHLGNKGEVFAQKNGQVRQASPNSFVPQQKDKPALEEGDKIDFFVKRESKTQQVVFYHVYGETYLNRTTDLMRIYWNLPPEGAPHLIEQITKIFNAYQVPFSFKCLNHPDLYYRRDSAVLYFDKDDLMIVWRLVQLILKRVEPYLKDAVPLFTEPIHRGVSIAEDPGGGKSFGDNRCKAIAEALVSAYINRLTGEERKDFIYDFLTHKGINPRRMAFHPHTKHFLLEKLFE